MTLLLSRRTHRTTSGSDQRLNRNPSLQRNSDRTLGLTTQGSSRERCGRLRSSGVCEKQRGRFNPRQLKVSSLICKSLRFSLLDLLPLLSLLILSAGPDVNSTVFRVETPALSQQRADTVHSDFIDPDLLELVAAFGDDDFDEGPPSAPSSTGRPRVSHISGSASLKASAPVPAQIVAPAPAIIALPPAAAALPSAPASSRAVPDRPRTPAQVMPVLSRSSSSTSLGAALPDTSVHPPNNRVASVQAELQHEVLSSDGEPISSQEHSQPSSSQRYNQLEIEKKRLQAIIKRKQRDAQQRLMRSRSSQNVMV
eukprot:m.259941 g.259941  ORF g.259941 m.259941 type:complete len:311 (+) comp54589_c0_seq4:393-1325(+)